MKTRYFIILLFIASFATLYGKDYCGRITDNNGQPISYATVYPEDNPVVGTATNDQGIFHLRTDMPPASRIIVSFIGYEKQEVPLSNFANCDSLHTVVLSEQPIALEETVVSAKASKQKNKRKAMAQLLYQVYNRMLYDLPDHPVGYRIVSDVAMDTDAEPWGMEQMIATTVHLPEASYKGYDSIQFAGQHCKRFLDNDVRNRADRVLESGTLDNKLKAAAHEVDSGTIVHKSLWASRKIQEQFENSMNDVRHWEVTHENEGETVLTHTEKHNFMGIFKIEIRSHYIVHSDTYTLRRFSEECNAQINIPFGYKLKEHDLQLLNLLNVDDQAIEKFRLRKVQAHVRMNTILQRKNGKNYIKERNLQADALLTGSKKAEIPLNVRATQRVTEVKTDNIQPLTRRQMTQRVQREIVPIY